MTDLARVESFDVEDAVGYRIFDAIVPEFALSVASSRVESDHPGRDWIIASIIATGDETYEIVFVDAPNDCDL